MPHQRPRSSNYAVMTIIVAVVCVVSLMAAAWGMANDHNTRLKVCQLIYRQMVGVHTVAQNDQGMISKKDKKELGQNLGKMHRLLMKHCPPETDDPPAPKKPAEQLGDVLKGFIGE
jgi:hypothetical protein